MMRFGLFCSPKADKPGFGPETGQGFFEFLDFNVEAEALGFHSSFSVEHHFSGWNQVSSTLMLLAALAMRTTILRLGTAVIVPPWHNPVLLAEDAATLDLLSAGRLDLGIGKGYRHSEFKGFQIAPEEAEARFEEALEVMMRAWTTRERFSHKGRFWHFEDIVVEPPPAQRPHPPLWVAAGNPDSIKRAAARGFNLILDQYASPATLGERIAIYKAEREVSGFGFNPIQVAVARQLYVAKDKADKDAALLRQAEYTRRTIDASRHPSAKAGSHVLAYADRAGATEENALYGTPEEVAGMIEALRDNGVAYVLLAIAGGVDQLRRFAQHPKLVGVRHAVHDEPDDQFMLRPAFLQGLQTLGEFDLVYDLLLYPRHLPVAAEVVRQFPRQRFVLDHIAKPFIKAGRLSPWDDDVRALARFDNVRCKVSGMVTEAAWRLWTAEDFKPYLDVVFDSFGSSRLMFGSDWPVCTLSADYHAVVGLVRDYLQAQPEDVRARVMGGNAIDTYHLGRA